MKKNTNATIIVVNIDDLNEDVRNMEEQTGMPFYPIMANLKDNVRIPAEKADIVIYNSFSGVKRIILFNDILLA